MTTDTYRQHLPDGYKGPALIRGDLLPEWLQRDALAAYLHRFTREHVPLWSRKPMPNGSAYRPLHASDAEWLARTLFPVTVRKGGALGDHTRGHCESYPTFPEGQPEGCLAGVAVLEAVEPVRVPA